MAAIPAFFPGTKSSDSPKTYPRTLTALELGVSVVKNYVDGTMGLFFGTNITVGSPELSPLDASTLESKLRQAWISARWKDPKIAYRVKKTKCVEHIVDDRVDGGKWADRTVHRFDTTGGWQPKLDEPAAQCGPWRWKSTKIGTFDRPGMTPAPEASLFVL